MQTTVIKNKILKGHKLALLRLIARKKSENSYLVLSENGKVIKKLAADIKL
jgi:hypothetical protein